MSQTQSRKKDHIRICLEKDVSTGRTGFDDVVLHDMDLVHSALPEVDFNKVDISCGFLGKKFRAPIIIAAMTGGTPEAEKINRNLAKAAQEFGIGMGVGSQRAAIENPELEKTYQVRDIAPDIFLLGNLGIVQFVKGYGISEARKAIEMIGADGMALHLNALQEVVQPEGDTNWHGCLEKIKQISDNLEKPVVVKETGAGISSDIAVQIEKAGASAIDIGGLGGTSWSLVESFRDSEFGKSFSGWGIPTAASLVECREVVNIPLIATGGIRNGIEVVKALALGADIVGIALPFLEPATKSSEDVGREIYKLVKEVKIAMFLSGAADIKQLRKKPVVITGKTQEWLSARGINIKKLAQRN